MKDFELFVYELIGAFAQFLVSLLGQADKRSQRVKEGGGGSRHNGVTVEVKRDG